MTSCTVLPGLLFDLHESVQGKKSVFIVFAACLCVCMCNCACVFLAWTNCPRLCLFSLTGGQISFLLAAFMRVCSQAGQC